MSLNQSIIRQVIVEQQRIHLPDECISRDIWHELKPLCATTHIVIIKGLRRCGKSTFMQWVRLQEKKPHFYFNFDDDRLIQFEVSDFQILLELMIEIIGPAKTVFFDEIQNIAGWERFIRRLHDHGYKIYITGSNARLFSRELGTHLTGRTVSLEMFPYSFSEYLQVKKASALIKKNMTTEEKAEIKNYFHQFMKMGGIPDYIRFEQPDYLSDLYESILYRDIVVRQNIGREQALKELLYFLASNVGKEISYNKLKNVLKLASATTVSDYCYFIEMSYLSFFINRYSASLKTQAHYGKKQYCIDQALAKKIGFSTSEDRGRLLENVVFLELKRRKYDVYYHKGEKECDFVVKESHRVVQVIQVAMHLDNEETCAREISGLQEAMQLYRVKNGLILTEDSEFERENVKVMPVWRWLLG